MKKLITVLFCAMLITTNANANAVKVTFYAVEAFWLVIGSLVGYSVYKTHFSDDQTYILTIPKDQLEPKKNK